MNLVDQDFFDLDYTMYRTRRSGRPISIHALDSNIYLMKNLFEPELVRLMNCDEQQLIVVGRVRQTVLQSNQFWDA